MRNCICLTCWLFSGSLCSSAFAATLYVTTGGNDANNGLTWPAAKRTVTGALAGASAGDQIHVAMGTYPESITLKAGVALYGGYAGVGDQRDYRNNPTVLDGRGTNVVVSCSGAGVGADTRLDGFVVQHGCNGIYLTACAPTIANNEIQNNTSTGEGAGICCVNGANAIIIGNIIHDNTAEDTYGDGAGICCIMDHGHNPMGTPSNPQILGNTIYYNVANQDGGGVCSKHGSCPLIAGNTIVNVPWSGIAVGWGWGLLDPSGYPGIPGATRSMWGTFSRPTPNRDCVIRGNRIDRFLQVLWDGGAIYTTGQQGTSARDGLLIEGNVASGKGVIVRADGSLGISGGNAFYTDGGSRYITLRGNVSFDDPVGTVYLGPPPKANDPLPYPSLPSAGNLMPYGSDLGGCRTYGDIRFIGNTWLQDPFLKNVGLYNALYKAALGFDAYSDQGFFDIGPYTDPEGVSHPTNLTYVGNRIMPGSASSLTQSLSRRLSAAGVHGRPATIPADRWISPAREP